MRVLVIGLAALTVVACQKGLADLKAECENGKVRSCQVACEKGEAGKNGCLGAALAMKEGKTTEKDVRGALDFAQTACEKGEVEGCRLAALMYERGEGTDKDPARSAQMAEKGCELEEFTLCYEASLKFTLDPIKDLERASKLADRGCKEELIRRDPTATMMEGSRCESARSQVEYQGQTTNFRTVGGGFATVLAVPELLESRGRQSLIGSCAGRAEQPRPPGAGN